ELEGRVRSLGPTAGTGAGTARAIMPDAAGQLDPDIELVVEQLGLQLALEEPFVDDVAFLREAGNDVLGPAVRLAFPVAGDAELDLVGDRARIGALDYCVVVVAVGRPNFAIGLFGRPFGDLVDGAADRVAAVEGALRPPQDLHPVQEQGRAASLDGKGFVDAVVVVGHRSVGGEHVGLTTHTPHRDP